jgi:L-amino acid N-acyltransferase YncA
VVIIRPALDADFESMWRVFRDVVASGDTYVFAAETPREDALAYWFGAGIHTVVAETDGQIAGMYKIVANHRDRGSHVANASFMVAPASSGKGVGRALGVHCLREARRLGFRAMQFNFVVSTNAAAVALWRSLGFDIVGTLPGAFAHRDLGFVDAYVMFRSLDDPVP